MSLSGVVAVMWVGGGGEMERTLWVGWVLLYGVMSFKWAMG